MLEFVSCYLEHGANAEIVSGLKEKVTWRRQQQLPRRKLDLGHLRIGLYDGEYMREIGNELMKIQTAEGDFPFDPSGRHKTNLLQWAALWRPLGLSGDSAVDLCATASGILILAGQRLREQKFLDTAHKTLEFARQFERPAGGDWWETPLHSPNLLAAGNAAIAYYLGYKQFGDERYLEWARHWIRGVIPFTHLWEPMDVATIDNTKPCLNTTSWFLSDWTAKHVQWEVLTICAISETLGIDWAEIDTEMDWKNYQRGVTTTVLRWMIDHDDAEWMFRSEFPLEYVLPQMDSIGLNEVELDYFIKDMRGEKIGQLGGVGSVQDSFRGLMELAELTGLTFIFIIVAIIFAFNSPNIVGSEPEKP